MFSRETTLRIWMPGAGCKAYGLTAGPELTLTTSDLTSKLASVCTMSGDALGLRLRTPLRCLRGGELVDLRELAVGARPVVLQLVRSAGAVRGHQLHAAR
jgi:hypothetical protein